MGSSNLLGVQHLKHPSVGIDIAYHLNDIDCDALGEYEALSYQRIDDAYGNIEALIDELNSDLMFHRLELRAGYHNGFQIIMEDKIDIDDIISTMEMPEQANDVDEILNQAYFIAGDGERYYISDFAYEGLIAKEQLRDLFKSIDYDDDSGYELTNISAVVNERAIEEIVDYDAQKGLNLMAKLARDYNLRLIVGSGYSVGVTRDDKLNEERLSSMETKLEKPIHFPSPHALKLSRPSM